MEVLNPKELFCERHTRMLRPDVLAHLLTKHRPGRTPSKIFTFLLGCAVKDVLFYQTAGHHPPKARDFEWDDAVSSDVTASGAAEGKR